jgi:putative tryptophan/tyrosine transport system substrate-binding protein
MRRREFIAGLAGATVAWPLAAHAQQSALPVIGYLDPDLPGQNPALLPFRKGLGDAGFIEGRNVAIEYRYAYARLEFDRLRELATDLVRRRVDVIAIPASNAAAVAAKAATTTIPIVFSIGGDPVALGLVSSLNRPGGNVTGASFLATGTTAKMLEVLHELVPNASISALFNPANPTSEAETRETQRAARITGVEVDVLTASDEHDIDAAFATLVQRRAGALIIQGDPLFASHWKQLVALTARHAIPAIFQNRTFAETGGLMSYGGSLAEASRIAGLYVGRILKGEKPADLPVQQSTRIEFVINLTTAKALGLTFPITLLGRADEVIERGAAGDRLGSIATLCS